MSTRLAPFLVLPLLAAAAAGCAEPTPSAPACGPTTFYAIDRIDVPDRSGEGAQLGVDLDGNGTVDNAVGGLMSLVRSGDPELGDFDAIVTSRMKTDAPWLVGVSACDDGTQHVTLTLGGGGDEVPLTALADPVGTTRPIVWQPIVHVTSHLHVFPDTVDGVIGFGLRMPDAQDALLAPFASYLTTELAAGTSAYAASVDLDHDGAVTTAELGRTDLMQVFLQPDVTFADGSKALSAGVSIHATRIELP